MNNTAILADSVREKTLMLTSKNSADHPKHWQKASHTFFT